MLKAGTALSSFGKADAELSGRQIQESRAALVMRFLSLRGRRLYSLPLLLVPGGRTPPVKGFVLFLRGCSGVAARSHLVSEQGTLLLSLSLHAPCCCPLALVTDQGDVCVGGGVLQWGISLMGAWVL